MKKDWVLTHDSFTRLLALLDADSERAAERYEFIRLHLIKMFEGRGCNSSADLADEVINRVARKIEAGEEIIPDTLTNYFYGVARNVAREYLRSPESSFSPVEDGDAVDQDSQAVTSMSAFDTESDREMDCLEHCLEKLPPETQRLILAYYDWEKGDKIDSRRQMAEEMGVTINTLRIRAHRIRDSLEKCALKCAEEKAE